ncbi:facilitated trehalose transporter Tret1-2 homolog [Nasonia vitripennis]|uniref:Major facilitator superfamily (MFS) profile domain-containing protein n=1 Tax=Nasonia vitripennis TaxID=7425 RepID=A0A7M7HAT7_NASVI|nr:facilitated trehalose transporter Tret1-2 homolog [Nasonia vitripennis]
MSPSPTTRIGAKNKGGGEQPQLRAPAATSSNDSYKEYVYSPVATSPLSSSVYLPTTLPIDEDKPPVSVVPRRTYFNFVAMEESGSKLPQYVAATAANLCIFAGGAMMGWTSPVLANMGKNDTKSMDDNPLGVVVTDDEGSWVGSLMTLGAVTGSLFSGYIGERFGRKKALLATSIPFLLGWALIATAKSLEQLYVARFIFGIAIAISFTVVPMYCGEIAETSIRGVLGSFLQLFVTFGLLYAYAIGPFVSYLIFWIVCAAVPIVFFACFMFMPESPYWLLTKGMKAEAEDALCKLRGKTSSGVQKELGDMQVAVDQAFSSEVKMTDLFTVKANFKALLLTCAGVSFQQLTGINVVLFYAQKIFASTGSAIDPAVCTIIVGVVQVCASGVTPIVVDRLGRRILLIASGVGTAVATGVLGVYYYIMDVEKSDVSSLGWLPIASLVLFMCLYCVGWGPLPWAIMGEMFSAEVKAKASGITVCICWALAFVITKFFSNIAAEFGNHTAFWFFTICCIVSVLFTVFLLPETKGKTLRQIQDELNGVKSLDYDNDERGQVSGK